MAALAWRDHSAMTYVNPNKQKQDNGEMKDALRAAIKSDARIYAICAEDTAGGERTIEYRFSRNESKQIYRAIRAILDPTPE